MFIFILVTHRLTEIWIQVKGENQSVFRPGFKQRRYERSGNHGKEQETSYQFVPRILARRYCWPRE